MSDANSDRSPAWQEAIEHLQAGRPVEAEETLVAALEREPEGSPAAAVVLNELGMVRLAIGRVGAAVAAFESACDGPEPVDPIALRDRLTFLSNLGSALEQSGDLAAAEAALRRGLDGRQRVYGPRHSGTAFGLEPLAGVLLGLGRLDEAADAIEEAVDIFWVDGHPRLATALALRAEIRRAADDPRPPFEHLEGIPDEVVIGIGERVLERIGDGDPKGQRGVLDDLVALLEARLGEGHQLTISALASIVNLERDLGDDGDPESRIAVARRVVALHDDQSREAEALQALQGLALVLSELDRADEALATYAQATDRADRLGEPDVASQVRRNHGLLLADLERPAEAEVLLREAVLRAAGPEMSARARIALGTFLQHGGRLDEARAVLTEALESLEPSHPDAICARGHLLAIESGAPCGCGDTAAALCDAFRAFLLERLPDDLLEDLDVDWNGGEFSLGIHLRREPSDEELARIERTFDSALAEFRRQVSSEP